MTQIKTSSTVRKKKKGYELRRALGRMQEGRVTRINLGITQEKRTE